MTEREKRVKEYYRKKREIKNKANGMNQEFDEKYQATKEKYQDDDSTFGKVANVTNEVARGVFKVLNFLVKNS